MLLVFAGLAALAGVWCLVAPPRAMLFGSRWQLRDGERAEPSPALIGWTRASGVLLLLLAAAMTVGYFVTQGQGEARESLKEAWGIGRYLSSDELEIELDPEVERVESVEATLAGYTDVEQGLRVWRSAIVGVDPVGDLGGDVEDGDLIVAVRAGACRPGPVLVEESDTAVTVSVTGVGNAFSSGEVIPCGASGTKLLMDPDAEELRLVRIPLDDPLGDRELILPDPPEREGEPVTIPGS
ncbi:hypothetical protein [Herbiconiux sp.]|uniref:hypothetical protein n=1 Tax=Herbiconiux sp. TaxID=1871186 RepID=UPI0025B8AC13|nr:hypothetical protein [Herbiconiux sp.]